MRGETEAGAWAEEARRLLAGGTLEQAVPAIAEAADRYMAAYAADEARALLQSALAATAAQSDEASAPLRCELLCRLAAVERWRGDFAAMNVCLREALPVAERSPDQGLLARLLVLQGAYLNQRMTADALRQTISVLARAAGLYASGRFAGRDVDTEIRCRFYLGQSHFYLGQLVEARRSFEVGLRLAEGHDAPFWRAKLLAFLGYLDTTTSPGLRDEGLRRLAEASQLQGQLGDRYGQGFTAALYGDALLQADRLKEAEAAFRVNVEAIEALGVGEDLVTGLTNLAMVQVLAGRYDEALAFCDRAVPMAIQLGLPVVAMAQAIQGHAWAASGEAERAASAFRGIEPDAVGSYIFTHAAPFILEGWLWLGELDEAQRLAETAIARLSSRPDEVLQAWIELLRAEGLVCQGRAAEAQAIVEAAAETAEATDRMFLRALVLRLRARLALEAGQAEAAWHAAEGARRLAEQVGAVRLAADAAALAEATQQKPSP